MPELQKQSIRLPSIVSELEHGKKLYRKQIIDDHFEQIRMKKKEKQQRIIISIYKKELEERKQFCSQSKKNGLLLEKEKDIFLCKEPLIDDFKKVNIIVPAKVLEKGVKDVLTGKKAYLDGRCFPARISQEKLSKKEKQSLNFWESHYQQLRKLQYNELLDSQTGLNKKINQKIRLEQLKILIPNNFYHSTFDSHPSSLLDIPRTSGQTRRLVSLDRNFESSIWSPNDRFSKHNQLDTSKTQTSQEFKVFIQDKLSKKFKFDKSTIKP